jgi:DNA-binding LytR/AlgR family response regulator
MLINCIIVEDEPLALKRTQEYVGRGSYLNLMASFSNGFEAIGFLKSNEVELLFLDVEMDGFTGIELLEALSHKPEVIITTAYDKYALKGFELNVSDYLLKPFAFDRFLRAVERVYNTLSYIQSKERDFLFVKTEYRLERVAFDDILFISGMGDYRCIQTTSKKILTLQSLNELEKALPTTLFCRVHKSYMVSVKHIYSVERQRIRIGKELIPISEPYKERFFSLIGG